MRDDHEALNLAADWADISQGLRKDLGHQPHGQWIKPIALGTFSRKPARSICSCRPSSPPIGLPTALPTGFRSPGRSPGQTCATSAFRFCLGAACCPACAWAARMAPAAPPMTATSRRFPATRWEWARLVSARSWVRIGLVGSSIGLDPSLTFASFVTGAGNVLAGNAAQRMAAIENPQFAPLYLKAATGQGKTHLLHAIGHAYLATHQRARIFYCSAERFMVEFVQALRQNQTIEFKARLRGFDLLLVDDIHFICGRQLTKEELLYTIDALLAEGKRLVLRRPRSASARRG